MSTRADRERRSEDARATSGAVLARLFILADRLEELGADLQAEVDRRRERNEDTDA